jgi:sigma-B regulation protein RsbU (phosphoserine phosphatase)
VVGLLPFADYVEGSVRIEPGDRLVAFTDGISECMSPTDEEWGEHRLIEAVRSCAELDAAETQRRLLSAADAFAAGARQHDDMTLVVVRSLPA